MIELKSASKRYGEKFALHPTDLAFQPGKTTALIGPSGCGKSTLIRLVMGLIPLTSGEVLFDGQPVTPGNAQDVRKRMGYVVQDGGLFPHLTAEGNALLMGRYLKRSESELQSRMTELAELTHFPVDGLSRYPAELSGGQKQRVSLMRALMLQPEALMLDEPLGALDPIVRSKLQTDLKEIFSRLNQTVILVTHDMAEAAYLADEIVLMNEGRALQRGSLNDLREAPASPFVSDFINSQRSLVML